jgi:hypothetical protein
MRLNSLVTDCQTPGYLAPLLRSPPEIDFERALAADLQHTRRIPAMTQHLKSITLTSLANQTTNHRGLPGSSDLRLQEQAHAVDASIQRDTCSRLLMVRQKAQSDIVMSSCCGWGCSSYGCSRTRAYRVTHPADCCGAPKIAHEHRSYATRAPDLGWRAAPADAPRRFPCRLACAHSRTRLVLLIEPQQAFLLSGYQGGERCTQMNAQCIQAVHSSHATSPGSIVDTFFRFFRHSPFAYHRSHENIMGCGQMQSYFVFGISVTAS